MHVWTLCQPWDIQLRFLALRMVAYPSAHVAKLTRLLHALFSQLHVKDCVQEEAYRRIRGEEDWAEILVVQRRQRGVTPTFAELARCSPDVIAIVFIMSVPAANEPCQ